MIARGFKSVIWVATVGGAALCCYMVSLRVATERADLAKVEGQIVTAKRDIRSLQTELGTRGRLTQLEQWNSDVLALSAPTSAQFVKDQVTLARLERHDTTVEEQSANIRMASAEVPAQTVASAPAAKAEPAPKLLHAVAPATAQPPMVRRASYTPDPALTDAKARPAAQAPAVVAKAARNEIAASKKAAPAPASAKSPPAVASAKPAAAKPAIAKPAIAKPAIAKPAVVAAATAKAAPKPAAAKKTLTASAADNRAPAPRTAAKPGAAPASRASKAAGGEGHR